MLKKQLHISQYNEADKTQLIQILDQLKKRFALFENTRDSLVENIIKSFAEAEYSGFGIGARCAKDRVIIDFNFSKGNPLLCRNLS